MKTATPVIPFAALAAVLAACCGGGGGGATGTGPSGPGPVPPALPALALQGPATAGNAPVLYRGASLHVGADVAPGPGALSPAGGNGDVRVSHGRVADEEGRLMAFGVSRTETDASGQVSSGGTRGTSCPSLRPHGIFGPDEIRAWGQRGIHERKRTSNEGICLAPMGPTYSCTGHRSQRPISCR